MLFLGGAVVCMLACVLAKALKSPAAEVQLEAPDEIRAPELIRDFQPARYQRTVYPYSVIPGGAYSREELAARISGDQVVAAHYADFKVDRASMVKAEETRFVHVSYRRGDKVYWTAKTLEIKKGETLIRDGSNAARARCGNRVSAEPQQPVSEQEPTIESFEVPGIAKLDEPELEYMHEPDLELTEVRPLQPYVPIPHPTILPYYYRPLFAVLPSQMIVPEPGTLSLLVAGLGAFFVVRAVRKK